MNTLTTIGIIAIVLAYAILQHLFNWTFRVFIETESDSMFGLTILLFCADVIGTYVIVSWIHSWIN